MALGRLAGCLERMEACPLQDGDRTQHRIRARMCGQMLRAQGRVGWLLQPGVLCTGVLREGAPCGPLVSEVSWGAALAGIGRNGQALEQPEAVPAWSGLTRGVDTEG